MIGQLYSDVLDAPAPAGFYAQLLGTEVPGDRWQKDPTAPHETIRAPRDPAAGPEDRLDPDRPPQAHLDIRVADVGTAEPAVPTPGA